MFWELMLRNADTISPTATLPTAHLKLEAATPGLIAVRVRVTTAGKLASRGVSIIA